MSSLNDLVLQIHMTFLSNKHDVDWITSFKDEIAPLSEKEFQSLVSMLEGVADAENTNLADSLSCNQIPMHLHVRAAGSLNFIDLIEKLKSEYSNWKS